MPGGSGLGLPCSKMKMRLVLRDRLLGVDWVVDVDQQMVMAAVLVIVAGESAGDGIAVGDGEAAS